MKDNDMQKHLIVILNRFSMRKDLVNKLFVDLETYEFRDDVNLNERWNYYIWVCKELKIKDRIMRSSGIDSDGGRKMKLEGHLNEELVGYDILKNSDTNVFNNILRKGEKILDVVCDGIKSKKVNSIIEDKKTTSKSDINLITNKRKINISVKKSDSGQVHINKVNSFIVGYEKIYSPIPTIVKDSLLFLFSGHSDTLSILENPIYYNELTSKLETHHETLTIDTMNKYNPSLSIELLSWVKNNIKNITEIVFKRGWAVDKGEWCDYIYYCNMIDTNKKLNDVIEIDTLIDKSTADGVYFGTENGGTTIILPFGSVQYHLGGLQFHHNRKKILNLIK
jgi:hypothetical protein